MEQNTGLTWPELIAARRFTEQYVRRIYPQLYPGTVPVPEQTIQRFLSVGTFVLETISSEVIKI